MNIDKTIMYDEYCKPLTLREVIFEREVKRQLKKLNCSTIKENELFNSIPYYFYVEDTYNGHNFGCSPIAYVKDFFKRNKETLVKYINE